MTLNLLVVFKSGKKEALIDIDYSDEQTQNNLIAKNGQIEDITILPGNFKECKEVLRKMGVVK